MGGARAGGDRGGRDRGVGAAHAGACAPCGAGRVARGRDDRRLFRLSGPPRVVAGARRGGARLHRAGSGPARLRRVGAVHRTALGSAAPRRRDVFRCQPAGSGCRPGRGHLRDRPFRRMRTGIADGRRPSGRRVARYRISRYRKGIRCRCPADSDGATRAGRAAARTRRPAVASRFAVSAGSARRCGARRRRPAPRGRRGHGLGRYRISGTGRPGTYSGALHPRRSRAGVAQRFRRDDTCRRHVHRRVASGAQPPAR